MCTSIEKKYAKISGPSTMRHGKDLSGIAKGAGIIFAGKIFGAIVQYVQLIVISKILGVRLLGGFLLGMTIVNIAGLISRLGLDLGVVKFVAQYIGTKDMARVKGVIITALVVSGLSGIVVALLLYFCADPLAHLFEGKPGFERVVQMLGATLPFTTIMLIALAATQGARIMRYSTYAQYITLPLINLTGILFFYFLGFTLNGVIGAFFLATIVAMLLALLFLLKTFPEALTTQPIFEHKKLFSVSLPLCMVIFLSFIVLWTDTIMLGYFKSSAEVGVYNTAMKTAMLISIILASFNAMFAPVIADFYSGQELARLEVLFKVVTKWIFIASLPFFFIMTLLSGEIMHVFGQEFAVGSLPLRILAFTHVINASAGCVGFMLAMSGRQKIVMYNNFAVFLINLLFNYYLIPQYGMVGAALATGIATISVNCLMITEVYLIFKMHPFSSKLVKPILFGGSIFICFGLLKFVTPDTHYLVQLALYPTFFLILFFWAFYKWSLAQEDEFMVEMIKSKIPFSRAL